MVTLATYISSSKFSISGEHDQEYEYGRRIRLNMAESGNYDVSVMSALYAVEDNKTQITVYPAMVQASLVSITRGASSANSVGHHGHSGHGDGGPMPASALSTAEVAKLQDVADSAAIKTGTGGEAVDAYSVCFQDTSDDGALYLASSDMTSAEAEACCISLESITDGGIGSVLFHGFVTNVAWKWSPGAVLWLSATPGEMTETQPMSGYAVRLGRAWTETEVFFDPQAPEYMGGGTT